jgi:hypothetical protein
VQVAGELGQVGAAVVEDVEAVDADPAVVAHPVGEERLRNLGVFLSMVIAHG